MGVPSYGSVIAAKIARAADRTRESEYLFKFLILTQIFMYLEAGAVPSLLQHFTQTFHLSPQEQGLLGAVVYISISLTSPWCSTLFRRFHPRSVLCYSLVVNNLALLAFACTPTLKWYSKSLLITLRSFIGLTQAFHCVYSPLWVHEYAPKAKRGRWMSFLQASTPIGITLGYFAGSVTVWFASASNSSSTGHSLVQAALRLAVMTPAADDAVGANMFDTTTVEEVCHGIYCWRYPFLFQFLLILPLSILLFFVPEEHIKLHTARRQSILIVDSSEDERVLLSGSSENEDDNSDSDSFDRDVDTGDDRRDYEPYTAGDEDARKLTQAEPLVSPRYQSPGPRRARARSVGWDNLRSLLQHKVYVFIVLGLSALFFVVAGVQFWTTLFLSTNTNDSVYKIHLAYLLVSGTGPILGVFFGGWLIDRVGGYAGPLQQAKALRVCMQLGAVGSVMAIPISYLHSTLYIALFLWAMLFCGGALLPACSGIVISSAPPHLRPLASSVAYTSYNLLGYAASNYIPGLIMNFIISNHGDSASDSFYCDTACTYRVGFRIVLLWTLWAFFCLSCGYRASKVTLAKEQALGRFLEGEEDDKPKTHRHAPHEMESVL